MAKDVIIALDFENKEKTLAFLDQFTGRKPFVKIGMELFYAEGPDIVREIIHNETLWNAFKGTILVSVACALRADTRFSLT